MTTVVITRGPGLPGEGRLEAVVVEQDGQVSVIGSSALASGLRDRAPTAMRRGGLPDLLHGFDYHLLAWS